MMKRALVFLISALLVCACTACSLFSGSATKSSKNYEDTIYTDKSAALDEIKLYTLRDRLYYFDCDFTSFSSIKIQQKTYNIYVNGKYYTPSGTKHKALDLSESADVAIVANYRVQDSHIYGFSIVSRMMESKMDHYVNNAYQYTSENAYYDAQTFSSIKKLYNNGTSNLGGAHYPNVSDDYYPEDYKSNYTTSEYLKVSGNINYGSLGEVLATPVYIITWDKDYDKEHTAIKSIIKYFTAHATYDNY